MESRYSQTEREALAVLWGCQHFHHYVFGRHIIINTDHKPLERLLSHNSNAPSRIQSWIFHLQAYNYTIRYIPGNNNPADFLSCNTLNNSEFTDISIIQEAEECINLILQILIYDVWEFFALTLVLYHSWLLINLLLVVPLWEAVVLDNKFPNLPVVT